MATPALRMSDTKGAIRTVHVGTPCINTTLEAFRESLSLPLTCSGDRAGSCIASIAIHLTSSRENETSLRSAPIPVKASRYLNGEVMLDIGMVPYESWTGRRTSKQRCGMRTLL